MLHDNLNDSALKEVLSRIRKLENGAPVGFTAITRGQLRVASNEGLLVQGSAKVEGWLIVTGTASVIGLLTGSGELIWTGPASFSGDSSIGGSLDVAANANFTGNTEIGGNLDVTGLTKLLNDLVVEGAGKILITGGSSPLTLQNGALSFGTGGALEADTANGGIRMVAGGRTMYVGTGLVGMQHSLGHAILVTGTQTTVEGPVVANDDMSVQGDFSAASKSFLIPHPTHADKMLRHGSSESPVHGVEYWGNATIGNDGAARVELPGYFESLALPDGRSVFVTGRGFVPGWTDIQDGAFTVTGTAGSAFSWLVKAARAVFEVEPTKPPTAEGTPE